MGEASIFAFFVSAFGGFLLYFVGLRCYDDNGDYNYNNNYYFYYYYYFGYSGNRLLWFLILVLFL
ncbi:hypothetical protein QBC44DRAFT_315517 [Cladorrhinum sp. PSN332]|nr:hypothetical protein QBC44DRAFT_315517 [Cladorrhinum sp. PSN332]